MVLSLFEENSNGACDMTVEYSVSDCIEWMNTQPADRFDLVFSSPPYTDCRNYGIGAQRGCVEWVDWMLSVTEAAARICQGPVVWVASGCTRKRNYWPACEGLMWEWFKRGGTHKLYRPCYWNRVGIPGSGGKDWFRADVEYVMCFKRPGQLPWSDNTAMGHPPKWAPGGEMSYRNSEGTRRNQWGSKISGQTEQTVNGKLVKRVRPSQVVMANGRKVDKLHTKANANGVMVEQGYTAPVLANPGNLVKVVVGGGLMGDNLCHENEAPFPEALAEWFIRSLCPPGGWCLDPFAGSGTTGAVCTRMGRNCSLVDVRQSQINLCRRRIGKGQQKELIQ